MVETNVEESGGARNIKKRKKYYYYLDWVCYRSAKLCISLTAYHRPDSRFDHIYFGNLKL